MDNIEDNIPFGIQQFLDSESDEKIWLNSIPVVNSLLNDLQRIAWHASIQLAKNEITAEKCQYLVNAKISELVQIFEGRNPAYSVLPWNIDPHQMKKYIIEQVDYWGDDADLTYDDVLPRLLDCCAAPAIFGVKSLLPDCPKIFRQNQKQVLADLSEQRCLVGALLMGIPAELFTQMAE
ncbi:TPA: hypothetical protein RG685_000097 [Morganella morganii]|nr:hypothetical protein [Morganella morganii]